MFILLRRGNDKSKGKVLGRTVKESNIPPARRVGCQRGTRMRCRGKRKDSRQMNFLLVDTCTLTSMLVANSGFISVRNSEIWTFKRKIGGKSTKKGNQIPLKIPTKDQNNWILCYFSSRCPLICSLFLNNICEVGHGRESTKPPPVVPPALPFKFFFLFKCLVGIGFLGKV